MKDKIVIFPLLDCPGLIYFPYMLISQNFQHRQIAFEENTVLCNDIITQSHN